MDFQPGVTNSGIPPFGIGTRTQAAADYRMPFQFPSFNHSSSLQILDQSFHGGGSEVETLMISPPLDVSQMDDLTAVVTKCKYATSFLKPPPSPSPSPSPSLVLPAVLPAKLTPQFRSNKRRSVEAVEGKQEASRSKRCGDPLMKDQSHRENHIFSERQRRSGMNQLLSKMRSLLPDQTAAKSDKATIVEETINYIHYLQRRLDIRIEKRTSIDLPKQGAETPGSSILLLSDQTDPSLAHTILCNTGSSDDVILPKISLNSHGRDLFITMQCGKKAGNFLSSIIMVVEEQKLNVMDAFVSNDDTVAFYWLHLKAPETWDAASREALEDTLGMLTKSELQH